MNAKILKDVKNAAKNLIEKNGLSVNGKALSLDETIDSILNASTPARKAHATRRLTSYAVSHAKKIGSTPTRVIAGVCAVVTKRMKGRVTSFTRNQEGDVWSACTKKTLTVAELAKQVASLKNKLDSLVKA